MRYLKFINILLLGLLLLNACQEDPTSLGEDLIPDGDKLKKITVDTYTSDVSQSVISYSDESVEYNAPRVLLGENTFAKSSAAMIIRSNNLKNIRLALESNNIDIYSTTLRLYPTYKSGQEKLNFGTYWSFYDTTAFDITKDNISDYMGGDNIVESFNENNDTLISVDLNESFIKGWCKEITRLDKITEDSTVYSLLVLDPQSETDKVIGFEQVGSDFSPSLTVIYKEVDEKKADTVVIPIISVYSVFDGKHQEPANGMFYLQGGLVSRAKLKFDLKDYYGNHLVQKATLEIKVDTTISKFGSADNDYLQALILDDSEDAKPISNFRVVGTLSRNGDTYSGDISGFVEEWLTEEIENNGIQLRIVNDKSHVNKFAFFGSDNPDKKLRPRITITYTEKNDEK